MTVKEKIMSAADQLVDTKFGIVKQIRNDNRGGAYLAEIYFWQELCSYAHSRLSTAWAVAQTEGFVPADDQLRKMNLGDHLVAESKHYSCLANISNPRESFDKETFIASVAKRYKISLGDLVSLADKCKKFSIAPLKKRVIEVE